MLCIVSVCCSLSCVFCSYCFLVCFLCFFFFFFKQKTAYEMRISDWSSDVCSSDLEDRRLPRRRGRGSPDRRGRRRDLGQRGRPPGRASDPARGDRKSVV